MNVAATVNEMPGVAAQQPELATSFPRWIITLVILVLMILAVLFVADRLYNPEAFRIREIEVHGQFSHVDGKQIKEVVEQSLSGNYFSVSLTRLESEIDQLPWVFSTSLRRQWPATLVVDVVEVQPVAKWGDHQWLNFTGDLVQTEVLPSEPNLPVLSGPDNQKKEVWQAFQRWSSMFGSNGLNLDELRLDTRGLWYLKLSLGALALDRRSTSAGDAANPELTTGESELHNKQTIEPVTMTVKREHAEERVKRFVDALNHQLIVEFPRMRSIDLRYPNGFAISWKTSLSEAPSLTETQ